MKINSVSNLSLLCAKINHLNNSKPTESYYNRPELMTSEASLAFKAQAMTGFRKVTIKTPDTKCVFDKVSNIFKKLPNSVKMAKPILIKAGEENYGFTWDKSSTNRNILTIKNNILTAED